MMIRKARRVVTPKRLEWFEIIKWPVKGFRVLIMCLSLNCYSLQSYSYNYIHRRFMAFFNVCYMSQLKKTNTTQCIMTKNEGPTRVGSYTPKVIHQRLYTKNQ